MFKINLLPKEVLERRRYEGVFRYVFYAAIFLVAIAALAYAGLYWQGMSQNNELQSIEEQAASTNAQAEQLSIFQNKEDDLQKRQAVAATALAGRVNVGEVANDISLVLPDEVWLDLLTINQDAGITLSANTPRNAGESSDIAYKSVAKTLVRLNELPELYDVWLGTASNATWSQWAARSNASGTPLTVKVVAFQATGKLVRPGASGSSTASGTAGGPGVGAATAAQNAVTQQNASTQSSTQGSGSGANQ